ncbi:formylglycine-generating enzyme family protein, partial [Klebsiella pneumoniae]|nr:formylglycine-generating enzyme family protein [Klebsiella pneumoniae]
GWPEDAYDPWDPGGGYDNGGGWDPGGGGTCTAVAWTWIDGGTFQMGDPSVSEWAKPVHAVTVQGFSMARTEVTACQYRQCQDAGGCTAPYDT